MVTIRDERPDDGDAIAVNHIAAWRAAYRGIVPDSVLDALDPVAWAARRRETAGTIRARMQVATDGRDLPIGHVLAGPYRHDQDIHRQDDSIGEIWSVYVHPGHWGTGTGQLLIEAGLAALPQAEVRLWVLEENTRARRFYERNGLHPDGASALWSPKGSDVRLGELRYTLIR